MSVARNGMEKLSARDLRRALTTVDALSRIESLDDLRAAAPGLIGSLVPCDIACFEEGDLEAGTTTWWVDPPEVRDALRPQDFFAYAHQHPLLQYHVTSGDHSTRAVSDFVSLREWRNRDLYERFYGLIDVDRLMAHMAVSSRGAFVAATACRAGERDFSARDRALLEVVRPHFARAHDAAVGQARAASVLAAVEDAELGVIVLGADGRVDLATAPARRWLRRTLGDLTADGRLPEPLDAWVRGCSSAGGEERLTAPPPAIGSGRVRVTYLPVSASRPGGALLIEPLAHISAAALREHGLTRREIEVVAGVARGLANAELADELMLSTGTVRKHLDRVYAKLGVHSRGEAVARALELSRATDAHEEV
jgi:DNA-binding CsgD family transcriptional regulator